MNETLQDAANVIAWLNELEEISLSHGSRDLDNDLDLIVRARDLARKAQETPPTTETPPIKKK